MIILYHNQSLNNIGKIYDQINSAKNIHLDSNPFIDGFVRYKSRLSVNDLTKIVDTLSSPEDANTLFKQLKINKVSAEEILKRSKFANSLNTVISKSKETAQTITPLSLATDGLSTLNVNQVPLNSNLKNISKGLKHFATSASGMTSLGAMGIFGGLMTLSTLADEWKRVFDYDTNQTKSSSAIGKYENTSSELGATIAKLEEIRTKKKR